MFPPIIAGGVLYFNKMMGAPQEDDIQYKIAERGKNIFEKDVKSNPLFSGDNERENPHRGSRFIKREKIKSAAAILLRVGEEIVGLMFVNYKERQLFDRNQKSIIEIFGNQAAVAIRNAGLFEKLLIGLRTIEKTGSQIINSHESEGITEKDILQPILEQLIDMGVDLTYISLYDKMLKKSIIVNASKKYIQLLGKSLKIDYSQQDWIRQRKTADIYSEGIKNTYIKFSDNYHLIENCGYFDADKNVRSALRVPLYSEGEMLGLIVMESEKKGFFKEGDVRVVISLANLASILIQNYRLIKQLKELQGIDKAILRKALNLNDVLGIILKSALKLVKKPYAEVSLLTEDNRLMTRKWEPSKIVLIDLEVDIDDSISGLAIKKSEPIYIKDVTKTNLYKPIPEIDTKSELVLPLMLDSTPIGVLNIESESLNDFTQEEVRILSILTNQAAIAIKISKNYEEIQKIKDLLVDADVRIIYGLSNFISQKFHKTGNIISGIKFDVKQILENERNNISNKSKDRISRIIDECNNLNKIADDSGNVLKDVTKTKLELDINTVLVDSVHEFIKPKNIDIQFYLSNNIPRIRGHFDQLKEVFWEFLSNACDAIGNEKDGIIKISTSLRGSSIYLAIEDNGCGIAELDKDILNEKILDKEILKEKLFQHGFTTKPNHSGQGLFNNLLVLKSHKANIDIASKLNEGTTFEIWFTETI
jgi:GAF domain-containing protein